VSTVALSPPRSEKSVVWLARLVGASGLKEYVTRLFAGKENSE
jgi:hypothetical protein